MGMLEARECQSKMIEPMIERLTRDRDAEPAHVGEVGQAHSPRRALLAEDHIAAGTVERPPSGDAALQGPAHARGNLGMPATNLLENRHRPDARSGLQHRHNRAVPDTGKRVRTPAPARTFLLRWQPRIGFDPIRGRGGKPSLRGGDRRVIALTGLHVQPRLAVGDMSARQAADPFLRERIRCLSPTTPTARPRLPAWGKRAAGGSLTTVGLPPPFVSLPPAPFSS